MGKVSAYEAKTHLPKLLNRVQSGERITITRHGVAVAELVPVAEAPEMTVREAIDALFELRSGQRLDGLSIRELIEEGRR